MLALWVEKSNQRRQSKKKLPLKLMKNCFYATFWTSSGQIWQLPVTGGYFRYLSVSFTATQWTCSSCSHWFNCITRLVCGPNTSQTDKKTTNRGFWPHFRSWRYPWLGNTWLLSSPHIVLQFWCPASCSYNASLPVKMETSGVKEHKNVHFRSRGWWGWTERMSSSLSPNA